MKAALALIKSPLGIAAAIIAALWLWTSYQRHDAAAEARAECKAAQLVQTITEITRQRDAAKRALIEARGRAVETAAEMTKLQTDHDQLQQDYENAKDACEIPDAAIKRLRSLR